MKSKKQLGSLFVSLCVVGLGVFGFSQRQYVYDWVRLRNYVPSSAIAALATKTTMNDTGKHLFYVNWPELQDKQSFNQSCTDSEQTIVLGCYIQNKGIYLFNVTDPRLNGVEEVTAAHEMLHAAYDRLSEDEKKNVDELTSNAFYKLKDERITKTIESYRKKDPSVVPNELHSIIGTEVRGLSPELEAYYKKYFTNRLKVVELSEQYEKAFTAVEDQAKAYKAELDAIRTDVEQRNTDLEQRAVILTETFKDLEQRRASTAPAAFNEAVRAYNAQVVTYNQDVQTVSGLIDQYNSLLKKYNALVVEENQLIKAIDSRPDTIQTE